MKSMFAIGFAFTSLLSMFNSIFDGKVVAKLPFTPISWLQGLSHRNLLGDDVRMCLNVAVLFLYTYVHTTINNIFICFIVHRLFLYFPLYTMYDVNTSKYPKGSWICSF